MSWLGTGKQAKQTHSCLHSEQTWGPLQQGGAKPHLKSICFILNWYLGPRLQLTNTTVTAIEITPLKIDVLGVTQSEYHILLLNEPLIPWAQWRAPPECAWVCMCVFAGGACSYVFAGRWGAFFLSLKTIRTKPRLTANDVFFIQTSILHNYCSILLFPATAIFSCGASQHRKPCRFYGI